jgi:hypothetical protein
MTLIGKMALGLGVFWLLVSGIYALSYVEKISIQNLGYLTVLILVVLSCFYMSTLNIN